MHVPIVREELFHESDERRGIEFRDYGIAQSDELTTLWAIQQEPQAFGLVVRINPIKCANDPNIHAKRGTLMLAPGCPLALKPDDDFSLGNAADMTEISGFQPAESEFFHARSDCAPKLSIDIRRTHGPHFG